MVEVASRRLGQRTATRGQVEVIRSHVQSPSFRSNGPEKKRVCAYCRVSTEMESQSSSYDLQVAHYTDFIQKNENWEFAGVYADEGISGTSTKNRGQFMRMIEDCKAGKIDYIVTKSISRFARNTLDCLQYIRELKGITPTVGVYFEKENLDTLDGKSELFLTILSSMAQEESRSISENTKWGVQKRFQQGKAHCPTTYFLGYDTDPEGNLVINEEEAKVVRRIFSEYLAGVGTPTIAKGLMRDGIRTARDNRKWTGDAIYKMLRNEKYCGDMLMQKTVTVDFLTHKRVPNRDIQPQYFIQDHHPAIIPKEDWYAVQEELKRRSEMWHDPQGKYRQTFSGKAPFSNVLYCADCGRPVIRRRLTTQRKGKKYLFSAWQCRASAGLDREIKQCSGRYVWEESLETAFMEMLCDMQGRQAEIAEEAMVEIELASLSQAEQDRMKEIEAQYQAVSDRLAKLAGRDMGANADIYDATIRQLNYEKGILQSEWDQLMDRNQAGIAMKRHLKTLFNFLIELEDDDQADMPFRDDIFRQVVNKGFVHNDGTVDFELKCGATFAMKARMRKSSKKSIALDFQGE